MNPDRPVRVKVACINRLTPDGRGAMAYTVNAADEYLLTRRFPTWADAMAFADRLARFIRTSHQITEGTDS